MIAQIIRKHFFCETDVCACDWKMNSQTLNVCNWRFHRKQLMKGPELHKIIPARKPCVTDVLCNWAIDSQIIEMCVIILGPIA